MMEMGSAEEAKAQELLESVKAALPKAVKKQLELVSTHLPVDQDVHFSSDLEEFKSTVKEVRNRVVTPLSQITSSNEFCHSPSEFASLSKPQDKIEFAVDNSNTPFRHPSRRYSSSQYLPAGNDGHEDETDAVMGSVHPSKPLPADSDDAGSKSVGVQENLLKQERRKFVWRRSAQVSVKSQKESPNNSFLTKSFKSRDPTSATLLEPGPSRGDANSGSSPAPPTISDGSTLQFPNKFIYRPPARTVPAASSPTEKQVKCSEPPEKENAPKVSTSERTPVPESRLASRLEPPGRFVATTQTSSDSAPPQPPVIVSSSAVRKVRIRCSKCGSLHHLWKQCPSDGKCARCSDPENKQSCATVVIRTRMMKDCRDSGDLSQMQTLLRSLKSDGHKPTLHSYSILLSLLVSRGKMDEARNVWKAMDEDGVAADTICYNTLLNGWCSAGKFHEAKAVLKEMKARKLHRTTSTYNTLIKGLGLAGRAAEAMKLLQQMTTLEETAKPNRQTYNILVNAWAQVKDVEQARRVVQLMRNAGLSPDVVTYNSLAKAYAELQMSFEAERVINEMKDVYIRPNERTYGIVINSYCETGRPEEGLALLDRMRMDGLRCNLPIYNILIKGFAQLYRPDKVDEVLELMEATGLKPDVQTFSLAMNVWCSAGLVEEARGIFERMRRDYELCPDVTAYTILAKGYVRARRPAEAESLLLEMTDQGLRPNVFTFTTVISGWCNVGNMEEACRVFKNMETCGVRPNSNTVSTLIWGFSESKQPHRAEEVLEGMKAKGIEIDRKCLELVAETWRSVGLPAEARRVLRGEVSTSTMPDESTLKTSFDSTLAGREILLDSSIHTKLNKEPSFADKLSSLKPPPTALTSTKKQRADITAKSLQQQTLLGAKTPFVDLKLRIQDITVGDKFTLRIGNVKCTCGSFQIGIRLNCREVQARTSNSIVTLPRATPWVTLVVI